MDEATPPDQPLKRKRGRPRKDGTAPAPAPKPVVLDHTGQPRKRGRPRKNPLDATPTISPTDAPINEPVNEAPEIVEKRDEEVVAPAVLPENETVPMVIDEQETEKPKPKRGRPKKVDAVVGDVPAVDGAALAVPKRGPGRPKKSNIVPELNPEGFEETVTVTKPKRGPGRPKKSNLVPELNPEGFEETVTVTKPKRGPGRPKKSDIAPANVIAGDPAELLTVAGLKRGPGRPKKSDIAPANINTEEATETLAVAEPKRGPGRPRKSDASIAPAANTNPEEAQDTVPTTEPKRGPGRPRKSEVTPVITVEDIMNKIMEEPKRKPGRPKKSDIIPATISPDEAPTDTTMTAPKRGRGRPKKNDAVIPAKASDAAAEPKRGRGRPKKSETTPSNAPTDGTIQKRGPGRPKKVKDTTSAATEVNGTSTKSPKEDISLAKRLIGSYEVTCSTVENEWPDMADGMEMIITEPAETQGRGFAAWFNLGILEGTMLLATDKSTLDTLYTEICEGGDSSRYCASFNPINDEDKDGDEAADGPTTKRQKTTPSSSTFSKRLYVLWRGQESQETSESQVYSGRNEGYIDFSESKTGELKFKGVSGFPAMGSKCEFLGTKVCDEVLHEPMVWTTEDTARRANEGRWR